MGGFVRTATRSAGNTPVCRPPPTPRGYLGRGWGAGIPCLERLVGGDRLGGVGGRPRLAGGEGGDAGTLKRCFRGAVLRGSPRGRGGHLRCADGARRPSPTRVVSGYRGGGTGGLLGRKGGAGKSTNCWLRGRIRYTGVPSGGRNEWLLAGWGPARPGLGRLTWG